MGMRTCRQVLPRPWPPDLASRTCRAHSTDREVGKNCYFFDHTTVRVVLVETVPKKMWILLRCCFQPEPKKLSMVTLHNWTRSRLVMIKNPIDSRHAGRSDDADYPCGFNCDYSMKYSRVHLISPFGIHAAFQ